MFPNRVDNGKFLLRPNGREVRRATFPNATRPNGRLHWATIVAHSVRWPLRGLQKTTFLGNRTFHNYSSQSTQIMRLFVIHAVFVHVIADCTGGVDDFRIGCINDVGRAYLVVFSVKSTARGRFIAVFEPVTADKLRMA